jgi:hypothetical protein
MYAEEIDIKYFTIFLRFEASVSENANEIIAVKCFTHLMIGLQEEIISRFVNFQRYLSRPLLPH